MDKSHQSAIIKMLCCLVITAGLLSYQFYNGRIIGAKVNMYSLSEPLYKLVYYPGQLKDFVFSWFEDKEDVLDTNTTLLEENIILKSQLQVLESLSAENRRLKLLLNSAQSLSFDYKLAEILNVAVKPFSQQVVINKGISDGVYQGQPVIDDLGILGQVTSVSLQHSLVTLITNSSQAVPVIVQRNGFRAVAQGSASGDLMTINFVEEESDIQEGDLLVTSGLGKLYPQGYPVAVVETREKLSNQPFLTIKAKPVARLQKGNHVILIWPTNEDIVPEEDEAIDKPILSNDDLKLSIGNTVWYQGGNNG